MPAYNVSGGITNAIYSRHSVRAYTADDIDRDTVHALLEAAVQAPTAMHEEPWAFLVVQDRALLKHVSDTAKQYFLDEMRHSRPDGDARPLDAFASPGFNIFYNAGTLIAICARPTGPFVEADCWLAAENLMLAACEMGLGSCVIGSAVGGLNSAALKVELGIPPDVRVYAPLIVGTPERLVPPSPRKPPVVIAWK